MEESAKISKLGIWWEYFKSEKHVFFVFLGHIVVSVAFIIGLRLSYDNSLIPTFTLIDLSQEISKYSSYIAVPSSAIVLFIINCFMSLCNSQYDVSFMSLMDQKKQKGIVFLVGAFIFGFIYFVPLVTNIINVIDKVNPDMHVKTAAMTIQAIILLYVIIYNVLKLKENGRNEIINFLQAIFIVSLLIFYPIKEGSLACVLLYWVFMIAMTFSIMHFLDTLVIWDTALYYFYEGNTKMYIHYRLDEDRVVCSEEALMRLDSKRKLYEITSLCKADIQIDASNSNANWDEAVSKIKELKKNKNKTAKTEKHKNIFASMKTKARAYITKTKEKIQIKISDFKEKHDNIKRLEVKADKYKNLAKKWEDDFKVLQKENAKLVSDIEKLENKLKGA